MWLAFRKWWSGLIMAREMIFSARVNGLWLPCSRSSAVRAFEKSFEKSGGDSLL